MQTCTACSSCMVRRSSTIVSFCEEVLGALLCEKFENMPVPVVGCDVCGRDACQGEAGVRSEDRASARRHHRRIPRQTPPC